MAPFLEEKSTNASKGDMSTEIPPNAKARKTWPSKPIIALLILSVIATCYLYRDRLPFFQTPTESPSWDDDNEDGPPEHHQRPVEPFEPMKRYSLDYGKVACWQNDGVWIEDLTAVEMSALGVDRLQDTERSLDQEEEDAFCARLRLYGASFWQLPPRWPKHVNWCEAIDDCAEPAIKVNLEVCFPETGGVWTLDTTGGWKQFYPRIFALQKTLTMEERCKVIKDLGGHFCEDIQTCPEMVPLIQEAMVVNDRKEGKDPYS
ncbi:hypothetical protein FQN49_003943 [Arthroderma sp. PD_2]|nr:hypothetical protein FQN49_003943 [Arthroderma sp. PD_2]